MPDTPEYSSAIDTLKNSLLTLHESVECLHITRSQNSVVRRFENIFSNDHLPRITQAEFESFLSFHNNCHWTNLARKKALIFEDMVLLRRNLMTLIDEGLPISRRFDQMNTTPGCGQAIISAILLVVFPKKYGVWNGTSEACLKSLKIWPRFTYGLTKGGKYEQVNFLLVKLAQDLKTDLWTLDAIFWKLVKDHAL